ncbi:MAG: glutathione-dependent disulfide-bond oxidoreductase [Pseudomonadota bacterium]
MANETSAASNQPAGYELPKVWTWGQPSGGTFASINRPISGPTHEQPLPRGKKPMQLHSLGTPNGKKVTIMLEELLEAGHAGAAYDAWKVDIGKGAQFGSGFVELNPNSKIPALLDYSTDPPTALFESGSMLFYLAEKFGVLFPQEHHRRAATMNWLMWQMGSAPFLGGGFGHFFKYAPIKIEYAINRYAMETKRLLHVLDTHLIANEYLAGDTYTIADIATWPWYGGLMNGAYEAQEFLNVEEYRNVRRWTDLIGKRPAVQRGNNAAYL